MPHRNFAGDYRLDARLVSELGRLFFKNVISQAEHDAGITYHKWAIAYLETLDGPEPYCDGYLPSIADDECFRRKINFLSARDILKSAGPLCTKVVDRVAIYDEPLRDDDEKKYLQIGLRALCGV
jgi:hypothetical protein